MIRPRECAARGRSPRAFFGRSWSIVSRSDRAPVQVQLAGAKRWAIAPREPNVTALLSPHPEGPLRFDTTSLLRLPRRRRPPTNAVDRGSGGGVLRVHNGARGGTATDASSEGTTSGARDAAAAARLAPAWVGVLRPGEMIFVPAGCPHEVLNLAASPPSRDDAGQVGEGGDGGGARGAEAGEVGVGRGGDDSADESGVGWTLAIALNFIDAASAPRVARRAREALFSVRAALSLLRRPLARHGGDDASAEDDEKHARKADRERA